MAESRVNEFTQRGKMVANERAIRAGFVDSISELAAGLDSALRTRDSALDEVRTSKSEIVKLRGMILNFEKLITARDRFGCWVCSKHERESM